MSFLHFEQFEGMDGGAGPVSLSVRHMFLHKAIFDCAYYQDITYIRGKIVSRRYLLLASSAGIAFRLSGKISCRQKY
jgi:hypothetical protein